MRKLIVTEFVTLDGVIEEPTPWQAAHTSPDIGLFKREELFSSGALLLGRVTYEGLAGSWPTATDTGECGGRMNVLPKYVVSSTLQAVTWHNSHLIRENFTEEITSFVR